MVHHMLDANERVHSHMNALHCAMWFTVRHRVCGAEWEGTSGVKKSAGGTYCAVRCWVMTPLVIQYVTSDNTDAQTRPAHMWTWAYCRFPPSLRWVWGLGGSGVGPHRSRCLRPVRGWGSGGCCSGWRCRLSEQYQTRSRCKSHLKEVGRQLASWSEAEACHRQPSTTPTGSESRLWSLHWPGPRYQAELWMNEQVC